MTMHSQAARIGASVFAALFLGTVSPAFTQVAGKAGPDGAARSAGGDGLRVSLPQARNLAVRLNAQGQPRAAREIALKLLEANPDDAVALIALAQAERLLGRYQEARQAGRRAWAAASEPMEHYAAALVTAQAISAGGSKLMAQFWLRRAVQVAPTEALRAKAARDFRYVRSRSLTSVQLRFSVAPSSNINNGSSSAVQNIAGLPFLLSGDARALSGLEYSAGVRLRYRLPDGERLRHGVSVDLQARAFTLSSDARTQAPDARASDYSFQQITLGYDLTRSDADGSRQNFINLGVGANWYGGSALTNFLRVTAGRSTALNKRNSLRWSLTSERQWRQDSDSRSATIWTLAGDWFHALEGGDRIQAGLYLRDTSAASPAIAHSAFGASLSYNFAKPIFANTGLRLSLGLETREYDRVFIGGILREDDRANLSATMIFRDVEYYGFSPTATISASRTSSSVDLYDTDNVGIKLGLSSNF